MPPSSLTVVDSRTGKEYQVPIQDGSVDASSFAAIPAKQAEEQGPGLKVYDDGLRNTAVRKSSICYLYARESCSGIFDMTHNLG